MKKMFTIEALPAAGMI